MMLIYETMRFFAKFGDRRFLIPVNKQGKFMIQDQLWIRSREDLLVYRMNCDGFL